MTDVKIACLTDVPLGYGSPQIQYLLDSLFERFRPRSPVLVYEPHYFDRPDTHDSFPHFSFCRVVHPSTDTPYWNLDGRSEQTGYMEGCARWLEVHRPDVVVTSDIRTFEAIELARHKPRLVIEYALESLPSRDLTPAVRQARYNLRGLVSLSLFPEKNRRRFFLSEFSYIRNPSRVLYNVPPLASHPVLPASRRNGRVLLQALCLQSNRNYPEYLLNMQRPQLPVDVFGALYGSEVQILAVPEVAAVFGVRYLGHVTNEELARSRACYSFALVMWNPREFNSYYACPNKFFEAIASGVPPISAPHPQCREIIRKYDCGVLLKDWSFDSFCAAFEEARSLLGTQRYRELVSNCRYAHRSELHWKRQFHRIERFLPPPAPVTAASRRRPRLIVCDPDVRDNRSYHHRYMTEVLRGAACCGLEPVAVVDRQLRASLSSAASVHPVLRGAGEDGASTRPEELADRLTRDLEFALKRERTGPRDHIFMPHAAAPAIAAIARWLPTSAEARVAHWHLNLSFGPQSSEPTLGIALKSLCEGLGQTRLHLHAESREAADAWSKFCSTAVSEIPIPLVSREEARASAPPRCEGLHLVFIGRPLPSGQLHLVPELVRAIRRASVRLSRVTLHIRPTGGRLNGRIGSLMEKVQRLEGRSVRVLFYWDTLSDADYLDLIRRADIVFTDGDPAKRSPGISRVFAEAVSLGRVAVVPAGSWMARQLPPSVSWAYASPREAPRVVGAVIRSLAKQRLCAEALQNDWLSRHNGEALVQALLGLRADSGAGGRLP